MIGRGGTVGATGSTTTEDPEGRISVGSRLPAAAADYSCSPAPVDGPVAADDLPAAGGGLIAEMRGSVSDAATDDPAEDSTSGADAPVRKSAGDPKVDSATESASDPALAVVWSPPLRHML